MAYEIGTALNYLDLLDKFRLFLTTNAQLVADSRAWAELRWAGGTELILKAPGLSGTEEIYSGIVAYEDTGSDYYNWKLRGFLGYQDFQTFDSQPAPSPSKYICLWNGVTPYWFVANGQRAIMIAKISTTYQALYLGKFLPYATPGQYPYPAMVGGTHDSSGTRWSSTSENFRSFWNPGRYGSCVFFVDGTWRNLANYYESSGKTNDDTNNVYPKGAGPFRENPDGTHTIIPFIINISSPSSAVLGELDGVYYITGLGNASEDTVTIDGITYLVVQDTYRTTVQDYAAIKLE